MSEELRNLIRHHEEAYTAKLMADENVKDAYANYVRLKTKAEECTNDVNMLHTKIAETFLKTGKSIMLLSRDGSGTVTVIRSVIKGFCNDVTFHKETIL